MDAMPVNFWVLPQGIIIGFSVAAPVGPIGILCIQRTLSRGRVHGLTSGLGAASADAIYGSIAGFGLTLVSEMLIAQQKWLQLIGGVFLCYLGIRTLVSRSSCEAKGSGGGLIKDYISTFFLTITNPMTILSFAAVFVGLGIGNSSGNFSYAGLFVAGIFMGSAFWWVLLASLVGFFRAKFDAKMLRAVNMISGLIILGFGLYFLLSFLNIL